MSPFAKRCQQDLKRLGFDTDPSCLLDYLERLVKWNKAYNLTAIRDIESMWIKHVLDSLVVAPHLKGQRICDVGSGAGLPGIPLAIAHPDKHFVLLDSNGKKTRFLLQVKFELQLENVEVVNSRVEQFKASEGFDMVIARAFSSASHIIDLTRHLVRSGGTFLLMKGVVNPLELEPLQSQGYAFDVLPLDVPHLDEQRHLIAIRTN